MRARIEQKFERRAHQLETRMRKLRHMAHYDRLTSLPNRALFYQRLSHAFARVRRTKKRLALLFLDLDELKQANDSYGHHTGDLLLRAVADRLKRCLREVDTAARLGGDEFTILVEELDHPKDAEELACRILSELRTPLDLGGVQLSLSTSIGIALHPDHADSPEGLLQRADAAMYHAKREGRHRYHRYEDQTVGLGLR